LGEVKRELKGLKTWKKSQKKRGGANLVKELDGEGGDRQ